MKQLLTKEKGSLHNALTVQVIFILLLCLITAVIQGSGLFADSHYSLVLMLSIGFLLYFGFLFYMKETQRLVYENTCASMMIFLGTLIRCSYVLLSGLYDRQHDAGVYTGMGTDFVNPGHIGYIEYIYKFGKLPDINPYELFAYYHPPLHHILSCLWLKLNLLFGVSESNAFENLQILPLLYSCLCMMIVFHILKTLRINGKGLYMGLAFLVFHPALVIMAGSVNNDMLTILFMCLTIAGSLTWIREKNLKNLVKLALSIGFGMITKLNSAVLALPLGLIFLMHFISVIKGKKKSEILKWVKNYCIFGVIAVPIGLSWIIRNLIRFGEKPGVPVPGETSPMYTADFSLWARLGIPSLADWRISFPFHPISAKACCNTWVIMLHTSLFTEEYPTDLSDILLVLCQITFVLAIIFSFVTALLLIAVLLNRKTGKEDRIFLLTGYIVMLVSFAAFVIIYPYTCSSDFRYVAICLVYIAIALGLGNTYYSHSAKLSGNFLSKAAPVLMKLTNFGILAILVLINIIYVFWERW
jgi:hypothetical protein